MKTRTRFFYNALLLASSSLAMRSIAVSFSIYVSGKAGAEAMGLFSIIMSVFGFALTVATSGVNLAVTRMVSEALGKNDMGLAIKSMKKCIEYCMFFSTLSGSVLFIFSGYIGTELLNDARTVLSLKILAVALPFISLTSAFNGYFTAVRRVSKNAFCQILEQSIKIGFTVLFFNMFLEKGVEYACISLVAADAVSEFCAFLISLFLYLFDKTKFIRKKTTAVSDKIVRTRLLSIALPVAFSAYIRSGLLTIEHILIPRGLSKNGAQKSGALATYGMLHGMVMPVILYPIAIISSFSGLLIPELSECIVKYKRTHIRKIILYAFKYSLLFSFCVSGILICFSNEFGEILYSSSEAGNYIRLIAPLVPIMYLDSVTDAMLKGIGEQVYSMNVNIIDALLSIILVATLIPRFGINGYITTIYVTETVNASFSILRLISKTNINPKVTKLVLFPLFCIMGATSVGRIVYSLINFPFGIKMQTVLCVLVIVFSYILFIRITGTVTKRDMLYIKSIFKKD